MRNENVKIYLMEGNAIRYRSSGNSMYPRIKGNDMCFYAPVENLDTNVDVDDVVFCQVQPSNHFYAHLVWKKVYDGKEKRWYYGIGSMQGRWNGWTTIKHIYGRFYKAEH